MKYNLKKINIDVEKDGLQFPDLRDRIIEKRGHVVEFSLSEIEANDRDMEKQLRDQKGMFDHRQAIIENIEHHHPFVKDLSDEQLLTVWMYKDAMRNRDQFKKNIDALEKQLQEDKEEIEEILKQIPELANVKSAEVVEGELKIEGEE